MTPSLVGLLTQSGCREADRSMQRDSLIAWMILLVAAAAHSQSDEEILEMVLASATETFLDQASWTLPESFHNSGLAPADKERLIEQWANSSAACLTDALAAYADTADAPLSEMVSDDGSFSLKGDGSSSEFRVFLESCIERAWAAVGASLK